MEKSAVRLKTIVRKMKKLARKTTRYPPLPTLQSGLAKDEFLFDIQ